MLCLLAGILEGTDGTAVLDPCCEYVPQCYAQTDNRTECRPQADDYLECLHHTKEVSSQPCQRWFHTSSSLHMYRLLVQKLSRLNSSGKLSIRPRRDAKWLMSSPMVSFMEWDSSRERRGRARTVLALPRLNHSCPALFRDR